MIRFAAINGTSTAYKLIGNGPALLMLHGGEGGHAMFDDLVPLLAGKLTLILYDQRDCGATKNPPAGNVGLELLADDARALIVSLGFTKAHVFGTSFGGRLAQVLALRHPQVVDKLVLGSTWPASHTLAFVDPAASARLSALRQGLPGTAEELVAQFIDQDHLDKHPRLKDLFKTVNPASDRALRRTRALADQPSADIGKIEAATLLMAGERDKVVAPAITMAMGELIANSRQVLLPGVGHATSVQAPQLVADQLKAFLCGAAH
jgi:3-oxoadipate enol-lactonase